MSINIYWGGSINDSHPLYAALSPEDKKFLLPESLDKPDPNLLALLVITKISFVSPESIVSVCERIRKLYGNVTYESFDELAVARGAKDFRHYLNRFCGVRTNLDTLSTADFGKFLVNDLPKLTSADARKYEEQQRRVLREKVWDAAVMNEMDEDFIAYARQCTDAQLEHVLEKEWDAFEHRDYVSAYIAAAERGWTVKNGKRLR